MYPNLYSMFTPHRLACFAASAALLLTGCDESPFDTNTMGDENSVPASSLAMSVPPQLKTLRALNLDALYADIVINGVPTRWSESTPLTRVVQIPEGEELSLQVSWFETQADSTPLLLATYELNQQVDSNLSLSIDAEDYISDGNQFDADSDGYSNLFERQRCSSPLVASSTPENCPHVRIGWINPVEAPVIDGLYDSIWNSSQFDDVNGESLLIDNLMIDQGATLLSAEKEVKWSAMHDDTYLYIFVYGENVSNGTPFRDSTNVWQDDNVNIYIDGDNSKLDSYDGVDDRHILIPLLTSPEEPDNNSTIVVTGANSAELPEIEFGTCLCSADQHTWEIKLRMSDFNIQKSVPFGLDVHLDDDNNGGARNARWGWFHPARTNRDIDFTWQDPSYMAIAVVE